MIWKELVTKLGFNVEHAPLEKLDKQIEGIKHSLEFLAAAEVVRGVYELTEKFAHFAEELHIAAISAGITVEAFQKLAFAAGHSAVSQEEMSMSMARLARNLQEARLGGQEAQKAFLNAGFTIEQVKGLRTGSDAMLALADRFKEIQDPIQKQALAMQLLGRGSLNMVGFLSQGSGAIHGLGVEAEKLGVVLSEHQVEALVKVEHSLNDLFAVIKSFGATIASYFAPSIETAIKSLLKFWEVNKKIIDTNVRAWVWDVTFALGFVYEAVKTVLQKFIDFAASHQLLVRRVSEILVGLGLFIATLWVVQKVLGFVGGAFELLETAISPIEFTWAKIFQPALFWIGNLIRLGLSRLFLSLASLTETMLPALSEAFLSVGAAIEATPIGWLLAGIAALVVILHDAWTLISGGKWEDTWIAKAINAAKGIGGAIGKFFGLGGEENEKKTFSEEEVMNGVGNANKFAGGISAPISTIGGGASSAVMNNSNTFNIYGNNPKEIANSVHEKFSNQMDIHNRRLQQSFTSAQAY